MELIDKIPDISQINYKSEFLSNNHNAYSVSKLALDIASRI